MVVTMELKHVILRGKTYFFRMRVPQDCVEQVGKKEIIYSLKTKDPLSGEGVFGLRRAFVQAGALNLILTLWRVEDAFTKNLMLEFYRDYTQTGDAVGALSRVQRDLLTKIEPRFWAPFLISVQGSEKNRSVGSL